MKNTPGPWHTQERGSRFRLLVVAHPKGKGTEGICEMVSASPIRNIHNAAMIAAAPELFDALEHLLRDYEQLWSDSTDDQLGDCEDEASVKEARAAVAKAKGVTHG